MLVQILHVTKNHAPRNFQSFRSSRWRGCSSISREILHDGQYLLYNAPTNACQSLRFTNGSPWSQQTGPPGASQVLASGHRAAALHVVNISNFRWKVLAVHATSDAPERMFSVTGNIMTEKRTRLTCDHLEELMYVHEVCQVG